MNQYEFHNFKGCLSRAKRNFVRENIKNLKYMQDLANITAKSQEIKPNKFKNVAPKVVSNANTRKLFKESFSKRPFSFNQFPHQKQNFSRGGHKEARKITHIGVQTERPEDIQKLYEFGTLKYPSPSVVNQLKQSPQKTKEQGDSPSQSLAKSMQKLDLEEKQNHIKQNIKSIKSNKQKQESATDPLLPPPNYQKGAVPKYLKDRKNPPEDTTSSPTKLHGGQFSDLVLLPDDERKEYLRVARENYASLIKELNGMPMSNDTLKKRRRKMEIEDELKRLDEVIKIFQKPKVFVKADA